MKRFDRWKKLCVLETVVWFANEKTFGIIKIHCARRWAMNTHLKCQILQVGKKNEKINERPNLVFNAATLYVAFVWQRTVFIRQVFRYNEQRDAYATTSTQEKFNETLTNERDRQQNTPLVPSGASGRRANTIWMILSVHECSPHEMKIFVPVML